MSLEGLTITPQERAVWLGLCASRTVADIAGDLNLKTRSMEQISASLRAKLGVKRDDPAGLVRAAAECGLLAELPPLVRRPPTPNQLIA